MQKADLMSEDQTILRGRYKIIREISRGGMGVVYQAKDLLNNHRVAVKKSFFSGDNQARKAFEIEAKLLARLEHQGLPKVLDYFFLEDNFQALVMDYIEGETLAETLESTIFRNGCGIDSAIVLDWTLQILNILKYLHNFNPPIIHRDIKPNNIKLTADGKIVLLDFGLAKGSAVTVVGGMSGYSPIEQVHRTGTDPRSDIYALGTTLFHLLTSQYPFTALDRFRSIYGQSMLTDPGNSDAISFQSDPQKAVAEINPQVPQIISEIVMKAMALLPKNRFQTSEEMKFELTLAKRTLTDGISSVAAHNQVDTIREWEKKPSLLEDDEEILAPWDQQIKPLQPKAEKNDVKLDATVSSTSLFDEIKQERPSGSLADEEFSDRSNFKRKSRPSKMGSKLFFAALGGIVIVLLGSIGILVWYMVASDPPQRQKTDTLTTTMVETPPAEPEPQNPINISIFHVEKNGEKTIRSENHQFAEKEEFNFLVKSPTDGFLFVLSRNNQAKAALIYPNSEQTDNFIKKDSESVFPRESSFEFKENTPSEAWVYFVVVASREDGLAKRLQTILNVEKDISVPEVGELLKELDKYADPAAKNKGESPANQPVVGIIKIQKRR